MIVQMCYATAGEPPFDLLGSLRKYIVDEARTYSGVPDYDIDAWREHVPTDIPAQVESLPVFSCVFCGTHALVMKLPLR